MSLRIKTCLFSVALLVGLTSTVIGGSVGYAAPTADETPGGSTGSTTDGAGAPYYGTRYSCPEGQTHLALPGEGVNNRVCCPNGSETDAEDCTFAKYLNPTIRLLSAVAGSLVIIGLILGGIQYSASGGDPQKAAAGKAKITAIPEPGGCEH